MKTNLLFLFLFLLFSSLCTAQVTWHTQTSGTNYYLYGACFVDENNGWVSGEIGIILHTTDGGESWTQQPTPANYALYTVYFKDMQNGWAAGYGGEMIHTTDGGANWVEQDIGSYQDLYKVVFPDAEHGWAAGGSYDFQTGIHERVIYNTTDGGESWNLQYGAAYESELRSIYFTDSNTGYAAGLSGVIMKTTDAGNNWNVMSGISGSFELRDIFFTDTNTGYVVGENLGLPHYSVIFKTTDGANSWTQTSLGSDEFLGGIYFTDALNGWAVGNNYGAGNIGVIYHTNDGGENWLLQTIPQIDAIFSVYFLNSTKGWAVGALGTIITTDNPTPVELTSFSASTESNNVILNWKTASETNNEGFEILRAHNRNWLTIDFVRGNGTSAIEHNYTYTDKNLAAGSYKYKLSQVDFDGTRNESNIVNVDVAPLPDEYTLAQNYPNPFNNACCN